MGWDRAEVQGCGDRKARSVQPQLLCVLGRGGGWVVFTPWKRQHLRAQEIPKALLTRPNTKDFSHLNA